MPMSCLTAFKTIVGNVFFATVMSCPMAFKKCVPFLNFGINTPNYKDVLVQVVVCPNNEMPQKPRSCSVLPSVNHIFEE